MLFNDKQQVQILAERLALSIHSLASEYDAKGNILDVVETQHPSLLPTLTVALLERGEINWVFAAQFEKFGFEVWKSDSGANIQTPYGELWV